MKLKDYRSHVYLFCPAEGSKLDCASSGLHFRRFHKKSSLLRFLNGNIEDAVNGTVLMYELDFGSSRFYREWFVWYDPRKAGKVKLYQMYSRGEHRRTFARKRSKSGKIFQAHQERIIELMIILSKEMQTDEGIQPCHARNLIKTFYKAGLSSYKPDEESIDYINHHANSNIDFWYWSDRMGFSRMKAIEKYFQQNNLI